MEIDRSEVIMLTVPVMNVAQLWITLFVMNNYFIWVNLYTHLTSSSMVWAQIQCLLCVSNVIIS